MPSSRQQVDKHDVLFCGRVFCPVIPTCESCVNFHVRKTYLRRSITPRLNHHLSRRQNPPTDVTPSWTQCSCTCSFNSSQPLPVDKITYNQVHEYVLADVSLLLCLPLSLSSTLVGYPASILSRHDHVFVLLGVAFVSSVSICTLDIILY